LVEIEECEVVVVGLPLSLDGSEGPAARDATNEARQLATVVGVPVEMYDERFTTVTAEQAMRDAGLSGQRQRKIVDQMAAAVMLQAWLDHRRHTWDKP
jgi:putative Holliday junction resolvase